jgi:hypothetical protein
MANSPTGAELRAQLTQSAGPATSQEVSGVIPRLKQVAAGAMQLPAVPMHLMDLSGQLAHWLDGKVAPDSWLRMGVPQGSDIGQLTQEVAQGAGEKATNFDQGTRKVMGLPEGDPLERGDLLGAIAEFAGGVAGPGALSKTGKVGEIVHAVTGTPTTLKGKAALTAAGSGILGGIDALFNHPAQADELSGKDIRDQLLNEHHDALGQKGAPDVVMEQQIGDAARKLSDIDYKLKKDGENQAGSSIPTWMYVAAAGAGAYGAIKLLKQPRLLELGEKFGVNKATPDMLSAVDKLAAGQADKNIPITKVLRKAGDEVGAQYVDTTQVAGTLHSAVDSLMTTGRFAEAPTISVPKLMDMANKFQGFDPEAQKLLANAIRAKDKLAYYKAYPSTGVGAGESVEELKDLVNSATMVPEMKQFMQQYKGFTNGWARYLNKMDVLGDDAVRKYTSSDYFYMPNIVREGKSFKFLDGWVPNAKNDSYLGSPSALLGRDTVPDGMKLLDPIRALEQYSLQMMDYARQNKVRMNFVDTMKASPEKALKGLVTLAKKPSATALPIRRAGKVEYWEINNPTIRDALSMAPEQAEGRINILNKMRHGFQFLTTGHGNPFAAPANFMYDTLGAAFLSDANKPLGAFKGDVVGSTIRSLGGAYTGIKDRFAKQAFSYLNYALNSDSLLKSTLGEPALKRLSLRAGDAWQQSVTNMMERYGASHGGFAYDDTMIKKGQSILSELTPEFAAKVPYGHRAWSLYTSVLDGIQNAARTAYFSKYGKNAPSYAKMIEAAYDTRNLVGDYAKFGNSPAARSLRSVIPYYNPSVQSMYRIGQSFHRSPLKTAGAVLSGGLLPASAAALWMTQASPEHRQWYLNDLSPYERDAYVWLPSIDVASSVEKGRLVYNPPQESVGIALMPELRPFAAMSRALVLDLAGSDTGLSRNDADRPDPQRSMIEQVLGDYFGLPGGRNSQDIASAVGQALPLGMPPALQAGLNLAGKNVPLGAFSLTDVKPDLYTESDMSARIRSAMGSLLGWTGQFGLQAADAYKKSAPGKGLGNVLEQAGIQVGQKLPTVAAPLFGYNRKLASTTVDANVYYSKVHSIDKVSKMVAAAQKQMQGMTGGQMDPSMTVGMLPNIVGDPQMMQAMQVVARYAGPLDHLKAGVAKYKALIDQTQARTDIGPKAKANITNLAMRRMHDAQNDVTEFVQRTIEKQLSQMIGHQVMVEDLDAHSNLSDAQ